MNSFHQNPEKVKFIKAQIKETVQQDLKGVTVRLTTITCECGWKRGIMHMFQCLYCSQWYCQNCAESHFGKTIEKYRVQENKK